MRCPQVVRHHRINALHRQRRQHLPTIAVVDLDAGVVVDGFQRFLPFRVPRSLSLAQPTPRPASAPKYRRCFALWYRALWSSCPSCTAWPLPKLGVFLRRIHHRRRNRVAKRGPHSRVWPAPPPPDRRHQFANGAGHRPRRGERVRDFLIRPRSLDSNRVPRSAGAPSPGPTLNMWRRLDCR